MAIQPRFRVYDYFHIYWSNFKILFYACVVEGCSASLTIAREKQTSNLFHLRWSSVENRVSRDVLTGKVYCIAYVRERTLRMLTVKVTDYVTL